MTNFESQVSVQCPAWNKTDEGHEVFCKTHGIVNNGIENLEDAFLIAHEHNQSHVLKPGCYVDGGRMNIETGTEYVIEEIAKDRGFVINDPLLLKDYENITWVHGRIESDDDNSVQEEVMRQAIEYLNENWVQDGYWAGWFEGDFGVWANED